MHDLTPDDVAALGLTDEDLEALEGAEIPDQPEVDVGWELEDAIGHALESRRAALAYVGGLGPDQLAYLGATGLVAPDPQTDGIDHEHAGDRELARFSRDAGDAEDVWDFGTIHDVLHDLRLEEELGARADVAGGVRIPGALWRPFTNRAVSTTPLIGPRAIILHTIVGTMAGAWSTHNAPGKPYVHAYYDGIGNRIQPQGVDRRAAGTLEGNPYVIAFETEDHGKWFPGAGDQCGQIPPWRTEQLRVLAVDAAFCAARFGIPAALMRDSCAGTMGIGYHRLGIDPWRKAGCLAYSKSFAKCCPDVKRIAQVPGLIAEVARILGTVSPSPAPAWPPPFPGTVRLTVPPMSGTVPRTWQLGLREWAGFVIAPDGVWGDASDRTLRAFQSQKGLAADGIGGPTTWTVLARMSPRPPTSPAPTPTPNEDDMPYYHTIYCTGRPTLLVTNTGLRGEFTGADANEKLNAAAKALDGAGYEHGTRLSLGSDVALYDNLTGPHDLGAQNLLLVADAIGRGYNVTQPAAPGRPNPGAYVADLEEIHRRSMAPETPPA